MTDANQPNGREPTHPIARKRPYVPPKIERLGSVEDLTRSGGSVMVADTPPIVITKTTP